MGCTELPESSLLEDCDLRAVCDRRKPVRDREHGRLGKASTDGALNDLVANLSYAPFAPLWEHVPTRFLGCSEGRHIVAAPRDKYPATDAVPDKYPTTDAVPRSTIQW